MVSLKEADWEYILREAPADAPVEELEQQVVESAPPGLESPDHAAIDELIVSRAFARGKPRRKNHHKSFTRNEILLATAGGVFALLLLSLLIYLIQM
ncbi:MAG TPA: hypothetical protein VH370_25075 [Humisphaera sp.]|jgi:hypothetical protein|nr:hypothetical protein [Humisphaera sp.]